MSHCIAFVQGACASLSHHYLDIAVNSGYSFDVASRQAIGDFRWKWKIQPLHVCVVAIRPNMVLAIENYIIKLCAPAKYYTKTSYFCFICFPTKIFTASNTILQHDINKLWTRKHSLVVLTLLHHLHSLPLCSIVLWVLWHTLRFFSTLLNNKQAIK